MLVYKGIKLAVVEAKSSNFKVGEGAPLAKQYAEKLKLQTTYASNILEIYSICMQTGIEGLVTNYLTPGELWAKTYQTNAVELYGVNEWREKFELFCLKTSTKQNHQGFIRK